MKLCIDHQNMLSKPRNAAVISARLASQIVDVTIQELAQFVVQPMGRSWCPSYFDKDEKRVYQRKNDYWLGQAVFALDFDGEISWLDVHARCKQHRVYPAFAYTTFSSVDANKFRVVFQNHFEVQDARVRNVLQYALMELFPECDKACRDCARLFYGGKELIHEDFTAFIDIANVVESMCCAIMENDKGGHVKRVFRKFCESTGLDMMNGLPKIVCVSMEQNLAEIPSLSNYMYSRGGDFAKIGSEELVTLHFSDKISEVAVKSASMNQCYEIAEEATKRNFVCKYDFSKLEERCKLYRDFISGDDWLYHHELFGLATNLLSIEGGKKCFVQALSIHKQYEDVVFTWTSVQVPYINKRAYVPQNCDAFCKHASACDHAKNLVETGQARIGRVIVYGTPSLKPLKQAEDELKQQFERILQEENNNFYVIKAPTGIGKTEAFLNVQDATIAVPRHNLKDDIANRMKQAGNFIDTTPEPPKDAKASLARFFQKGQGDQAEMFLQSKAAKDPRIAEFLRKRKAYAYGNGACVSTHKKLLIASDADTSANKVENPITIQEKWLSYLADTAVKMREVNNKLIIIDEDIVSSTLECSFMALRDYSLMCAGIDSPDSMVKAYYETLTTSSCGEVPTNLGFMLDKLNTVNLALAKTTGIQSNVSGLFSAQYWRRSGDYIHYVNRGSWSDKKTVLFSATASEEFYRQLLGDRLEFIDLGNVENKGRIIQYPQFSYSRSSLASNKNALSVAKAIAGDKPVITFKANAKDFDNCVATFGNLSGLDSFSGRDIVIVGTPHIPTTQYWLIAAALNMIPAQEVNEDFRYIPIRRNGMEYYFNTFVDNPTLRSVQLQMIEAELFQAVGRARILRNDCTVTVLSNFPIPGAEFKYLTKDEMHELTKQRIGK